MSYTPNFNDKRVITRCKQAVGFTLGCFDTKDQREWSSRHIDKYFGISSNKLSNFLRKTLLIVTDAHYSKDHGKCKKYVYNQAGVQFIQQECGFEYKEDQELVEETALDIFFEELKEKDFSYEEAPRNKRLLHPLQNYRKQYKRNILKQFDFVYEYDIVACAPTLLHQHSWRFSDGHWLEAIGEYTTDRSAIRKRLALEADLPEKNIKKIMTALFSGGFFSTSPKSAIFKLCLEDASRVKFLKQDTFIIRLLADIKQMWIYLSDELPVIQKVTNTGKIRNMQMTPKAKWNLYFKIERRILDFIRCYLETEDHKVFLEHDGFTTDTEVNINELTEYIYQNTDYDLLFDEQLDNTVYSVDT